MVNIKTWRKHLKKKCFILLVYCCIMYIIYATKDVFQETKHGNCSMQNFNYFQIEKSFNQYIDIKLKTYFANTNILRDINLDKKWTTVASNLYVYSTFLEVCPPLLNTPSSFCVKFIAIVLSNCSSSSPFLSTISCGFNNSRSKIFTITELLPENHFKLFTAAHVFCPLPNNIIPTHAFLRETSSNATWFFIENYNAFKEQYFSEMNSTLKNTQFLYIVPRINVCIRPMFDTISAVHLSEFLVYYSIVGIDHFIFYYMKSFEPMSAILNLLKFSNVSNEMHFWDIPLDNNLIHEYGQIAFIQDCIARSKNKFTHTLIVDFDEYIATKIQEDIKNLVVHLDNQYNNAGSYVIPMNMFCDEFSFDYFPNLPFRILNHKRRQKTPWQHRYRSKIIIRPDRIRYSGIHFTWKLEDDFEEIFISPSVATVNHYKTCCGMGQRWFFQLFTFKVLNDVIIIDNTIANHQAEFLNHHLIQFILNLTDTDIKI